LVTVLSSYSKWNLLKHSHLGDEQYEDGWQLDRAHEILNYSERCVDDEISQLSCSEDGVQERLDCWLRDK
jgi:hypothetical protein